MGPALDRARRVRWYPWSSNEGRQGRVLKHLNVDEMVGLIRPWVRKTKRRETFLSIPEIAPLHGKVMAAYEAVLAVQPVKSEVPPALKTILEKQAKVDVAHDNLARFITLTLDAHRAYCLAKETPDAERAAQCEAVKDKLFPNGMDIINASYLAEAGNTARVERLMKDEPEIPAFLKTIPAPGDDEKKKIMLLDLVNRWIGTGADLEALEHDREEIDAKRVTQPVTAATITAARAQWFGIVRAILGNLELSDAPAAAIAVIRGPIERASERAGKRYKPGQKEEPVVETDELDVEEAEPPAATPKGEG